MLSHFASDLQKLGTNIAGLNKAAQDALIAQGIEWYYWQGTDYAGQEFFTQTGESLQYTTAMGAGLANAQNKAFSYTNKWLTPSGRGFTVYLSQGAKAGDTLTLKLTGLAGKGLKAVLGNTTVDADGAVITLNEGQTQASFALIQEGATLDADTPGSISLAYQGAEQSATSNAWGVNLKDTGELARTYNGDQCAKLTGIAINLEVTPDKPGYNTYNWGATTWAADGVGDGHNRHLTAKHRSVPCRQRIRHPKLSHRSFLLQVDQMQVVVNH